MHQQMNKLQRPFRNLARGRFSRTYRFPALLSFRGVYDEESPWNDSTHGGGFLPLVGMTGERVGMMGEGWNDRILEGLPC